MHRDADTHETDSRPAYAIFGSLRIDHLCPFHQAATEPTPMHADLDAHDTAVNSSGDKPGTWLQVLPFHRKVPSPSKLPTARHALDEEHDTP